MLINLRYYKDTHSKDGASSNFTSEHVRA
jgi:hypothetical protein